MEWYIMNSSGVRSLSSGIGGQTSDGSYSIHDDCSDTLETLLEKIEGDSITESMTVQHMLAEGIIEKDLAPMVKYASPDVTELSSTIRLLTKLCQYIAEDVRCELPRAVADGLDNLNCQVCQLFEDDVFVGKLFGFVLELIEEAGKGEMARESYNTIGDLLNLIKRVLSASQLQKNHPTIKQLLLKNGLAAFLVFCIHCHARDSFAISVAQILTFLYVDFQWIDDDDAVDDCTSSELKRLIVRLLQGPIAELAVTLKRKASSDVAVVPSENYLAWCMAFFLPYLSEVPIPISDFRKILSNKFFGFLVYQASMLSLGQIKSMTSSDSAMSRGGQLQDSMCLIISAIDAVITVALSYRGKSLRLDNAQLLMSFYGDLAEMKDLWQILLLYIRCHNVLQFDKSFLCQLVCLNHKLLCAVSYYNQVACEPGYAMLHHVKQFASSEVINQYTILLESYEKNSSETNAAVCTLLCHIGTDCEQMEALYSYRILAAFNRLLDSPNATAEDVQLAELVLQSFVKNAAKRPQVCADALLKEGEADASSSMDCWSGAELSVLCTAYSEWQASGDIVAVIDSQLTQAGFSKSREGIITQLEKAGVTLEEPVTFKSNVDEVEHLVRILSKNENKRQILNWIHHSLVTASYVKAMPKDHSTKRAPLCNISQLRHHAYPIVPYTQEQEMALRTDCLTKRLLQCLKLYGDGEPSYIPSYIPRISPDLSAADLYSMAEKIHKIHTGPFDDTVSASGSSSSEEEVETLKHIMLEPSSGRYPDTEHSNPSAVSHVWLLHVQNATQ